MIAFGSGCVVAGSIKLSSDRIRPSDVGEGRLFFYLASFTSVLSLEKGLYNSNIIHVIVYKRNMASKALTRYHFT
jgi:hypothetical protein